MNPARKAIFNQFISKSQYLIDDRHLDEAFRVLEKAHVLGQHDIISHTRSHLLMLKVALLKKDGKEIFGQLLRIPLGIFGSIIGVVPVGNTGGSNVSAFKKMEITKELQDIIDKTTNS